MRRTIGTVAAVAALILAVSVGFGGVTHFASAQDLPLAAQLLLEEAAARANSPTSSASEESQPADGEASSESPRLTQLKALNYDRRPSAILKRSNDNFCTITILDLMCHFCLNLVDH